MTRTPLNKNTLMNKNMKKLIWPIAIMIVIAGAIILAISLTPKKKEKVEVAPGKIHDIEAYVRLCSVDIYSEVPVLDTVNNKVIFGIQKQNGNISFDIEGLRADTIGDTVRVVLPKEIIEIYESTEPNSWEVIDTKNISTLGFLKSSRLTADEENAVKRKIRLRTVNRLCKDGTVRRAREEAASNLKTLLEKVYRKPVTVDNSE